MKTNILNLGLLAILFLLFQNTIIGQGTSSISQPSGILMERTEIREIQSNIVEQNYELYISLPYSYYKTDTIYPVIFLLDPYRAFAMVKGFTDAMSAPFPILQEVIIVGIGYGGEGIDARLNYAIGRARDYTPVQDSATEQWYVNAIKNAGISSVSVTSGGAPLFLRFIKKELFPFVESNYRIDTNIRMLSGYSLGGLFGLYVLFHEPELFHKYFLGSPSIRYKDGISLKYESTYAGNQNDLNAEIFMSVGEEEKVYAEYLNKMALQLNSRKYKNLILETVIFENENHFTCYPAAMSRGLIELFNNK